MMKGIIVKKNNNVLPVAMFCSSVIQSIDLNIKESRRDYFRRRFATPDSCLLSSIKEERIERVVKET